MSDTSLSDDDVPILIQFDDETNDNNNGRVKASLLKQEPNGDNLRKVPVTILTGFLGSGKTTLVQHILRSPNHGKKIAVIENEFSGFSTASSSDRSTFFSNSVAEREGLNIETLIARDGTNVDNLTDLIELPNGCICCTVKDSLVETLESLIDRKRELDYIIIECSGMANPGPIASIFWLDDTLESRLSLDGVITCVDAKNIAMQLRETSSNNGNLGGDEAAQQIAYADRIIVNKIDLLHQESSASEVRSSVDDLLTQIRSINSTAPIRLTSFSKIEDLDWILDANCFDVAKAQELETTLSIKSEHASDQTLCKDPTCLSCGKALRFIEPSMMNSGKTTNQCLVPSGQAMQHTHTNAISTIALIERGSVSLKRLHIWLASILWPDQDKDDSILKEELLELERLGKITTPELMERRRREETMGKMLIFRMKGVLSVHLDDFDDVDDTARNQIDGDGFDERKYILQAVNDLWDIKSSSMDWSPNEERICKIVLIGRNLDRSSLSAEFMKCFVDNQRFRG